MRPVPFDITFRNIDRSDGLERLARKRIARLSTLSDRILAGRVTIEARRRAGHRIKACGARVELSLPGGSIVAGTGPALDRPRGRMHDALRGAFDAVERRLGRCRRRAQPSRASSDAPLGGGR